MTTVDDAAVVTGGVVVSAAVVVTSGVVVASSVVVASCVVVASGVVVTAGVVVASGVVVVASVIVVASAVVCDTVVNVVGLTVVNVVGLTVVSVIHITVNKHISTFFFEILTFRHSGIGAAGIDVVIPRRVWLVLRWVTLRGTWSRQARRDGGEDGKVFPGCDVWGTRHRLKILNRCSISMVLLTSNMYKNSFWPGSVPEPLRDITTLPQIPSRMVRGPLPMFPPFRRLRRLDLGA